MSAYDDAVAEVKCPDCKQPKGSPCVYMAPRAYEYAEEQLARWSSMRKQVERAGKPMQRAHWGRLQAARAIRNKAARHMLWRETQRDPQPRPIPQVESLPNLLGTYLSIVKFDEHGYRKLRDWLDENSAILTNPDPSPAADGSTPPPATPR